MYRNAGPEGTPVDTGQAMGANLYAREGAARAEFSQPAMNTGYDRGQVPGGPDWYNNTAAPPVKYSVPSAQKEYLQRKQAIRENIPKTDGVVRFDPVTDTEVEYLKTMEEQAELADFDRYVQTLINPRKPGNMKFLMEIYPQFVERRIKQAHTDYSYAIRKQTIDQWGVNTFDDLHFLYLMDQGKVAGPMLTTPGRNVGNQVPGRLARSRCVQTGSGVRHLTSVRVCKVWRRRRKAARRLTSGESQRMDDARQRTGTRRRKRPSSNGSFYVSTGPTEHGGPKCTTWQPSKRSKHPQPTVIF